MYFGGIDLAEFWEWIRGLPCNYSLTFDGRSGKKDLTYNVPIDLYSEHIYFSKQISGFRKLNKEVDYVQESLYIK